jgi:murein DD-endopeptidase MepM/ murein hydrolase activator NlpD
VSVRALAVAACAVVAGGVALAPGVVSGSAPATGGVPVPAPVTPAGFALLDARVTPEHAYFAGRPVQVTFTVRSAAPVAVQVDVIREATRKPVVTLVPAVAAAGAAQSAPWDGLTGAGEVAPNGRYRFRVTAQDGSGARNAGTITLHSHTYPIRGPHADRGPIGRFGVGRNGGRTHEGYDVDAACGTPLVAARGGTVTRAGYDPVLYGNVVIIRGDKTQRDYWYAHLLRTSRLEVGEHVSTGQRIGSVGATGNARTIGCHLHFEIHSAGRPIDPAPELHAWDGWS